MIRNYFKILLRFMLKQKGFSVIHVLGLTIGLACSLLILLYIQDELTLKAAIGNPVNSLRSE